MRFVETKMMLVRTRQLFIRQLTSVINAIGAHMASRSLSAQPVHRRTCRTPAPAWKKVKVARSAKIGLIG